MRGLRDEIRCRLHSSQRSEFPVFFEIIEIPASKSSRIMLGWSLNRWRMSVSVWKPSRRARYSAWVCGEWTCCRRTRRDNEPNLTRETRISSQGRQNSFSSVGLTTIKRDRKPWRNRSFRLELVRNSCTVSRRQLDALCSAPSNSIMCVCPLREETKGHRFHSDRSLNWF